MDAWSTQRHGEPVAGEPKLRVFRTHVTVETVAEQAGLTSRRLRLYVAVQVPHWTETPAATFLWMNPSQDNSIDEQQLAGVLDTMKVDAQELLRRAAEFWGAHSDEEVAEMIKKQRL